MLSKIIQILHYTYNTVHLNKCIQVGVKGMEAALGSGWLGCTCT